MTFENEVIHGDCIEVTKQMPDNSVHLIYTSPPYWGPEMWDECYTELGFELGTINGWNQYGEWLEKLWKECFRVLVPQGRLIINTHDVPNGTEGKWLNGPQAMFSCMRIGFAIREDVLWLKPKSHMSPNGSMPYPFGCLFGNLYEHNIVAQKPGLRERPSGENKEISKLGKEEMRWCDYDYWRIDPISAKEAGHVAPFPIALPTRFIKLYTFADDKVYDPFTGTGQTLLAAKLTGRRYCGAEFSARYVDHARSRLSQAVFSFQ